MKLCQYFLLLLLVISISKIDAKFFSEAIARDRLVRDLFTNYDAAARPAHKGKKIDLVVNLELQHFDFRESDGAFQFHGKLDVSWHDPKLRWSPKDYNNISQIQVAQNTLWVPDLEIYNNAPDKFLRMQSRGLVLLNSNGRALWADTIEMTVFCTSNMRRWPVDHHKCELRLGSWTYDGYEVDIVGADPNMTTSMDVLKMKNTEFRIVNYSAVHVATTYNCCEEPYITIDYHLEFERRSSFAIIFQMPAICVVLLTLAVFCLEPHRGEKLLLHGVSLCIIVFKLIYFVQNVGRYARNIPLIVIFYSVSFVLVTIATLLSVFALSASRSKVKGRLPHGLVKLLNSRLGMLMDSYPEHGTKPENAEMQSQFEDVKLEEYSNLILTDVTPDEWTRFAVVVERMGFIVYSVIFIILGTSCFA